MGAEDRDDTVEEVSIIDAIVLNAPIPSGESMAEQSKGQVREPRVSHRA